MQKSPGSALTDPNFLLDTIRLQLRRIDEGDQRLLERLFCDSEMMKYLGGTWSEAITAASLAVWNSAWGKNNYWYGVIVVKDDSEPIGIAGISENTNPHEPGIELAWFILPEHQRNGYAAEMTRALMEFVFENLKKERLFAEIHPENVPAIHLLESLRFKRIRVTNYRYDDLPGFDRQQIWEFLRPDWRRGES